MQIIKIGYRFVLCISILHFTCVFGQKDTVDADVRSERETHKTEVKVCFLFMKNFLARYLRNIVEPI